MVIGEQAARLKESFNDQQGDSEATAASIELNVIKRLEKYSAVWNQNLHHNDEHLRKEFEQYKSCLLAAEALLDVAKKTVMLFRGQVLRYVDYPVYDDYNNQLTTCDTELSQ